VTGALQQALECECCSRRLDVLHDFLVEADALVAKALKLSETAQIAKTEQRMRELLLVKWRNRAEQAADAAGRVVAGGGTIEAALRSVDKVMAKWATDVGKRYARDLEDIYYLARTAGWKKGTKQTSVSLGYDVPNFTEQLPEEEVKKAREVAGAVPVFDLYDKSAVAALHDDQMLWIGRHYDKNVSKSIRAATTRDVIAGRGRIEAGRKMREHVRSELKKVNVPKGFHGSEAKYFEGLAANAATVARVRGQVRSFQDAGVTRYEIMNPNDRRTSPQCQHMSGKVFTVKNAVEQIESEAGATDPDHIRKAHPWLSIDQMKKISPTPGHVGGAKGVADSRALAGAGLSLPPYHFRCRSTVDISVEAGSWEPLGIKEQPPVIPVKPRPKPVAAKPKRPTVVPPIINPAKRPATIPPEKSGIEAPLPGIATDAERVKYWKQLDTRMGKMEGLGERVGYDQHKRAAAGVRKAQRKLLEKRYGFRYPFADGLSGDQTMVISHRNAVEMGLSGCHSTATGTVTLARDVAKRAQEEIRTVLSRKGGKVVVRHSASRTMIHEEIHGYMNAGTNSYVYAGPGAFIEETTVEIAARQISKDMGIGATTSPLNWSKAKGWSQAGSYGEEIAQLLGDVQSATGWEAAKVRESVRTAAFRMRRLGPEKMAHNAAQHVDNFIDNIPDATPALRKAIREKLMKRRIYDFTTGREV